MAVAIHSDQNISSTVISSSALRHFKWNVHFRKHRCGVRLNHSSKMEASSVEKRFEIWADYIDALDSTTHLQRVPMF